ncbi:LpqB family beta-propeller domain-containing protein [Nonomuraea sp. NPDC050328]|uniref:LpqB family beta-propeller domain-containing protein n=1 Tax=Nonomuraea sp. NPDC050328 TaxID=3364361 RepID=UPI0037ACCF1A
MTRTAAVAFAVSVTCLGSGCSVISLSSAPKPPDRSVEGASLGKPFHRVLPVEPRPDWTPVEVVEGMQAAMAAFADEPGDKTLWKYLTADARKALQAAGPPVYVLDQIRVVPKAEDEPEGQRARVEITGNAIAQITDDGRYVPMTTPQKVTDLVTLQKQGGNGYRVAAFANTRMLLSAADVERAYERSRLYFLSSQDGEPVADLVMLRRRAAENLAESIVGHLLKGPSGALGEAVYSALPAGARVGSVRLTREVVEINLLGSFDADSVRNERGLKTQLGASLTELAKGRRIDVLHNGNPFYGTRSLEISPEDYNLGSTPPQMAFLLRGGRVLTEQEQGSPRSFLLVPGADGGPGLTFPAVSSDGMLVAALDHDGIWVRQDGQWNRWIDGTLLAPPAWRAGKLWTFDPSKSAFVSHDPATGQRQDYRIPDLADGTVEHFKFAKDGVRVAMIVKDLDGIHSLRVGVLANGRIEHLQTLAAAKDAKDQDREHFLDLAWETPESLLLLTDSGLNGVDLVRGLSATSSTRAKNARSVAVSGSRILLGTDAGVLQLNPANQTFEPLPSVEEGPPAYPAFRAG